MAKLAKKAKLGKTPSAKASVESLKGYSEKVSAKISARKKQVKEYTDAVAQKEADKKRKAQLRAEIAKKKAEYAKLR